MEQDGIFCMRHIYNYERILEPGEKTSPVFSESKVINLIEGEIPGGTLEKIPVKAHGMQSRDLTRQKKPGRPTGFSRQKKVRSDKE